MKTFIGRSRIFRRVRNPRRFIQNDGGALSIEFGILAPVLIGMLLAGVEFGRYVSTHQKAEHAVSTVANLVTQFTEVRTENMRDIFLSASQLLTSYKIQGQGLLVVTHIHAASEDEPKITWQVFSSTSLVRASKLGKEGERPKLPAGFIINAGQSVVAVESFVKFEPMLFDLVVKGQDLYKITFYYPRKVDKIAYVNTGDAAIDTGSCNDPSMQWDWTGNCGKGKGQGYKW